MSDEHFRRTTDAGSIEALIASENDPGKRTLLLILSSLNYNLIENTKTTEAVRRELTSHLKAFNSHVDSENEMLNKGKGAWKILIGLSYIVQVIIAFGVTMISNRIDSFDKDIIALRMADVRIETAIKLPEHK